MLRKALGGWLLFFTIGFSLYGQWAHELIPLEDPIYHDIEYLLMESGESLNSTAKPWSNKEALFLLSRVSTQSLHDQSLQLYDYWMEYLEERCQDKDFSVEADLILTPEMHGHVVLDDKGEVPDVYPWIYTAQKRPAWLEVPIRISLLPQLYSEVNFDFRQEPRIDLKQENYFTTLPNDAYAINLQFPHRAFINAGGQNWDLTLGRINHDWGMGYQGNMLVSTAPDWMDGLRFKVWYPRFSYLYMINSLEPRHPTATGNERSFDASKYAIYHSFHFSPLKGLHFSLTEAIILGGENFQLNLSHLNPMMLFHNWFPLNEGNSYHMIEVDYTLKYWTVYGQICLDQYQSSSEKSNFPSGANQPDAFGYMLGIRRIDRLDEIHIRSGFQAVLTMPYLYTHEDYWTRPTVYQFYSSDTGYFVEYPLGYPQGPDCLNVGLYTQWRKGEDWKGSVDLQWQLQGENRISTEFPNSAPDNLTPTGTAEHSWIIRLQGEKRLMNKLYIGGTLLWAFRDNPRGYILEERLDHYSGSIHSLEAACYLKYQPW